MGVVGEFRARAQTGIGADDGTAADMGAFQMRKGADAGTGFDRHAGAEDDIGFDYDIAAKMGVEAQRRRCRGP